MSHSPSLSPDRALVRESIRAELEANRDTFRNLIAALTQADLRRPSDNPAWTVGELLWHIALSLEYVPHEVRAARLGKNLMRMPRSVYDRLNVLIVRLGAFGQTCPALLRKYERAHAEALKTLHGVADNEWTKRTRFFYVDAEVEMLFRRQAQHMAEHVVQIRVGPGLR